VPEPMLVRLRTGTITFLFSVSFFAIYFGSSPDQGRLIPQGTSTRLLIR
jgi:hypothetical protein